MASPIFINGVTMTKKPDFIGFRRAEWGCYGISATYGKTAVCFDYVGHFELPLRQVETHEVITKTEFREAEDLRTGIRFADSLRFWVEDLRKQRR